MVVGSVPAAVLLGWLHIEQLYGVALAASALSVVFAVAYPAYLASLVWPEEQEEANSELEASYAVAEAVGVVSAFAGSLVAEWAMRRWGIGLVVIGGLAIYTVPSRWRAMPRVASDKLARHMLAPLTSLHCRGAPLRSASLTSICARSVSGGASW